MMQSERPDGNAEGDGYCGQNFFVNVVVGPDVIRRMEPDSSRPGMIPDRE